MTVMIPLCPLCPPMLFTPTRARPKYIHIRLGECHIHTHTRSTGTLWGWETIGGHRAHRGIVACDDGVAK